MISNTFPIHQQIQNSAFQTAPVANTHLSLSDFIEPIVDAVRSVSESKWVIAEISSVSGSTHMYLELIESDDSGKKIAYLRVNIWYGIKKKLLTKFEQETGGEKLRKGLKVLFKLKPTLHPQYGLSATVEDIDPSFTLGEAAAKLIAIRKRLVEEGKFGIQKTFARPTEFTSIAVVCPAFAAGLGDFKSHADPLENFNLCKFKYYTATFQGETSSSEIVDCFRQIYTEHRTSAFDCVVILRGGGSQADLAWLNDYTIASAISQMPLPVFAAIGHERDSTILDEVAHFSFHTPSKAINHIVETIKANAQNATETLENIMLITKHITEKTNLLIFDHISKVETQSNLLLKNLYSECTQKTDFISAQGKNKIELVNNELEAQKTLLQSHTLNSIRTTEERAKSFAEFVLGVGPKQTLARGFTIARNQKGSVIRKKCDTKEGDVLSLQFSDGKIETKVQ